MGRRMEGGRAEGGCGLLNLSSRGYFWRRGMGMWEMGRFCLCLTEVP